jgi:hypothetical protein
MSNARSLIIFRLIVMLSTFAMLLCFFFVPVIQSRDTPDVSGNHIAVTFPHSTTVVVPFHSYSSSEAVGIMLQQNWWNTSPPVLFQLGILILLMFPFLAGSWFFIQNLVTWRIPLTRRWYKLNIGLCILGIVAQLILFTLVLSSTDSSPAFPYFLLFFILLAASYAGLRRTASSSNSLSVTGSSV